jgi:hypothetical protein
LFNSLQVHVNLFICLHLVLLFTKSWTNSSKV